MIGPGWCLISAALTFSCAVNAVTQNTPTRIALSAPHRAHVPQVHLRGMVQAMEVIATDYLSLNSSTTTGTAPRISGSLDQFSVYLAPDRYQRMREDIGGEYASVGLTIGPGAIDDAHPQLPPYPWIDEVAPGSSAAAAGVIADDRLVAINGEATTSNGKEVFDASVWEIKLRGIEGSLVSVTVLRASGGGISTIELRREMLEISSVTSALLANDIGYIAVHRFSEPTGRSVQRELDRFASAKVSALILDLRGNQGGLISSATAVADLFLDSGVIVTIVSRLGRQVVAATLPVGPNFFGSKVSMVCLVDSKTASASEIVAAALQQHGRSKLVGENTFGKGSVQTFYDLADGAALKLTTAQYVTPNGKTVDSHGITPDLIVAGFAGTDIVVSRPTPTVPHVPLVKENASQRSQQTGVGPTLDATLLTLEQDDPQLAAAVALAKSTARIQSKK
jgi:carboxyl-terminal processing protease